MTTELARKIRGTRHNLGIAIKHIWSTALADHCEPLTLEDLERGDKFILMPFPGDNSGHGGLLNGSYLFIKTEKICHPQFPTNCIRLLGGEPLSIKEETFVIKVT